MLWVIPILIFTLSIYRIVMYHKKVKNYYKVSATIIGNDVKTVKGGMAGDQHYYSPIIEFTDREGNLQQLISGEDNPDRPLYTQGKTLTILVNPTDSSRFLIYDFVNGYLIPIIWLLIGIAVVAIPMMFPETFD